MKIMMRNNYTPRQLSSMLKIKCLISYCYIVYGFEPNMSGLRRIPLNYCTQHKTLFIELALEADFCCIIRLLYLNSIDSFNREL